MPETKPRVIVIVGPTASGKTAASIALAKRIGGEIISADSMQIYRHMNIGTAKPTLEEREGIPHYLFDVVEPEETFNVTRYQKMALTAIREILSHHKVPIIVGGTGLYVSTLIHGIEFSDVEEDPTFRAQMEQLAQEKGAATLHEELAKVDREAADKIDVNNVRRVIRALEIYHVTGKTKTELDNASQKEVPYDYRVYGIQTEREVLYERINTRVDQMIEDGLLQEVQGLSQNHPLSQTALQGLGYKEVIAYFEGKISYEEMIEKVKQESRHYAKRQLTWFQREKEIHWCPLATIVDTIVNDFAEGGR